MTITHTKVSLIADGPNNDLVLPSDWNASHTIGSNTITDAMIAAHTTSKITVPVANLAGAVPVANGGTGTASTLTGLVRGSATAMTAAELSGAVVTSGSNVTALVDDIVVTNKILNSSVTLAKIANAAANSKLVGSGASGSGAAYSELTLGTNLSMSGTTLNATSSPSGLTLIENKIFTTAATDYSLAGLDGDTDSEYLIIGKIVVGASGTPFFSLRFNAQATTYATLKTQNANGSITGAAFTEPYVGGADAGGIFSFTATVYAAKSVHSIAQRRSYVAQSNGINTVMCLFQFGGQWTDTTNNITSIQFHCDASNGIGDGSQIAIYKHAQS